MANITRKDFLKKSGLIVAGTALVTQYTKAAMNAVQQVNKKINDSGFSLPPLPYAFEALEPYIDKLTMEIHYTKHHQSYVDKLNKAILNTEYAGRNLDDLVKKAGALPLLIRNNAGGHWNHSFFWKILTPNTSGVSEPTKKVKKMIEQDFGSVENFKDEFIKVALSVFGSGWAWVIIKNNKLSITSTPNQDNPLMDIASVKGNPVIGLDVWEHSYYLKYQNRRAEYIKAFWNIINWEYIHQLIDTLKYA